MPHARAALPSHRVHENEPLIPDADPHVSVDVWPRAALLPLDASELMRLYRLDGATMLEAQTGWS